MLHSYGLDSNPGSEAEGSDLEVMDVSKIESGRRTFFTNFISFLGRQQWESLEQRTHEHVSEENKQSSHVDGRSSHQH